MSRAYPDKPLVGVGVVIRRGGEILLVRRGKPPARHSWSIPGGVQRLGETVADTARREVLEETGLTVDLTEFLGVVDFIDRDDLGNVRYHYTLLDFSAQWLDGVATPGDDVIEVRWTLPEQLHLYQLARETERMIRKALG